MGALAHLIMYSDIAWFCNVARLAPSLPVGNTSRPVETRHLSHDSSIVGWDKLASIESVEEYTEENGWESTVEQYW